MVANKPAFCTPRLNSASLEDETTRWSAANQPLFIVERDLVGRERLKSLSVLPNKNYRLQS